MFRFNLLFYKFHPNIKKCLRRFSFPKKVMVEKAFQFLQLCKFMLILWHSLTYFTYFTDMILRTEKNIKIQSSSRAKKAKIVLKNDTKVHPCFTNIS